MSDHTECKVLILWKNKSWEERYMKFIMPEGYTETELTERAVQATMSNLAAVGKLDNVHTMGVTTGFIKFEVDEEEKKEEDGT